jgi:hypothetical protein
MPLAVANSDVVACCAGVEDGHSGRNQRAAGSRGRQEAEGNPAYPTGSRVVVTAVTAALGKAERRHRHKCIQLPCLRPVAFVTKKNGQVACIRAIDSDGETRRHESRD